MSIIGVVEENYGKIKKYAERKSGKYVLTNISWLLLDETNDTEVIYIFKNDCTLIISENGRVTRSEYEFVVDSDSLVIQYTKENGILYNCYLIDDKFLVLKQSSETKYWVFGNKTRFKDHLKANISKIFKEESRVGFNQMEEIQTKPKRKVIKRLKDGRTFEIHSSLETGYTIGDKVTIDGMSPQDGVYNFSWFDSLTVEKGRLKSL